MPDRQTHIFQPRVVSVETGTKSLRFEKQEYRVGVARWETTRVLVFQAVHRGYPCYAARWVQPHERDATSAEISAFFSAPFYTSETQNLSRGRVHKWLKGGNTAIYPKPAPTYRPTHA